MRGRCGPGNLHLINGLFDAHRIRVPVLAIAAQIPSAEIGGGYFQETHPQDLFRECSHYCEPVSEAGPDARALEIASARRSAARRLRRGASGRRRVASRARATSAERRAAAARAIVIPARCRIRGLAELLNDASRVTLFCGRGCAGAHDELLRLGDSSGADGPAMRGKEHVECDNPFDVGMTGLIGFSSGYFAMHDCDVLLMLGTDFPYRQFYPPDGEIAQVDIRPENLGRRAGRPRPGRRRRGHDRGAAAALEAKMRRHHLDAARNTTQGPRRLDELAKGARHEPIHPQQVAKALSDQRPTMRYSPATSACRPSGLRATSP